MGSCMEVAKVWAVELGIASLLEIGLKVERLGPVGRVTRRRTRRGSPRMSL